MGNEVQKSNHHIFLLRGHSLFVLSVLRVLGLFFYMNPLTTIKNLRGTGVD